jgi:hypothetical protein
MAVPAATMMTVPTTMLSAVPVPAATMIAVPVPNRLVTGSAGAH